IGKDKVKDQDLETFKHKAAGCQNVEMHLVSPQADGHGAHTKPGNNEQANVEVAGDGSLKWHNMPNSKDPHTGMDANKTLVVAFTPVKPAPGAKDGELTARQIERLKQMVACLGETHTHIEVDKTLQNKAHINMIPT